MTKTVLSISRKWKGKYWMNRMSVTNGREKVQKRWDWNRGMMIFLWLKIEIWKTRWHSFLFLIYGKDGRPTARPCVLGLPFANHLHVAFARSFGSGSNGAWETFDCIVSFGSLNWKLSRFCGIVHERFFLAFSLAHGGLPPLPPLLSSLG